MHTAFIFNTLLMLFKTIHATENADEYCDYPHLSLRLLGFIFIWKRFFSAKLAKAFGGQVAVCCNIACFTPK